MRWAFVVAPIGLLGGWLMMRPINGGLEPGFWWTAAHTVWLLGFLAFVPVGLELRRATRERGWVAEVAAWVVVLSALANVAQMAIDLVAGARSASRAELRAALTAVRELPGAEIVIYTVGPQLIFIGLVVLVALLRPVPVPALGAVVLGVALLAATMALGRNHWIAPVGMALLVLGLGTVSSARPRAAAA